VTVSTIWYSSTALGSRLQGRGAGTEAAGLLARFLFGQRDHHRITIDPAAANEPAIRCYA